VLIQEIGRETQNRVLIVSNTLAYFFLRLIIADQTDGTIATAAIV
jgi:hypothetical protein